MQISGLRRDEFLTPAIQTNRLTTLEVEAGHQILQYEGRLVDYQRELCEHQMFKDSAQ